MSISPTRDQIYEYLKEFIKDGELTRGKTSIARDLVDIYPEYRRGAPEHLRLESMRCRVRSLTGAHGSSNAIPRIKFKYFNGKHRVKGWTAERKQKEYFSGDLNAKILILDVEVTPLLGLFWELWNQNISWKKGLLNESWMLTTWAGKWLFEDEIFGDKVTVKDVHDQNDKRVLLSMCEKIAEADIVVGHNFKRFDMRTINARRLKYKLSPLEPYSVVDTFRTAKREFKLPSYSLDFIASYLGYEGKAEHNGMDLWRRCLFGDSAALDEMYDYNVQDIFVQENVYLDLRPWIHNHPNCGLFSLSSESMHCKNCGSPDLVLGEKERHTSVNSYATYRCGNCGALSYSRNSSLTVDQKRFVVK